jgi:hypothetical protein
VLYPAPQKIMKELPQQWFWSDTLIAAMVPAAIGNAVFDAIGVRLRSVPFTPAKVLAAIKKS